MSAFTESIIAEAALEWFEALGYTITGVPSIAPGEPGEEQRTYAEVVLDGRLRDALARLNPTVSREGLEEAFRKLTRISSPQAVDANHELHYYLVNGVSVGAPARRRDHRLRPVRVVDFDVVENNDWLVVNQLTVSDGGHNRLSDVVVFLNGLPIAVIVLKERRERERDHLERLPAPDVKAGAAVALRFNELLVISEGLDARIGTLSSNTEHFLPRRRASGTPTSRSFWTSSSPTCAG